MDRRRRKPNRWTGHRSAASTDTTHNSLARPVREKASRTWHFRGITYVLRSDTTGGASLTSGCDKTHIGSDVRVNDDATYTFMKSPVAINSPYCSAAGRPLRPPMTQGSGRLKFYFHRGGIKRSGSRSCDWNSGVDGPMPLDDTTRSKSDGTARSARARATPFLECDKAAVAWTHQECSSAQRPSTSLIKSRLSLRHVFCVAKGVS